MELWLIYAALAAVFAALTTILAKIGLQNVDSHLATAIRTTVVAVFAWLIVFLFSSFDGIGSIDGRTWVFLIFSGLSTGASWLCYFHALKLGQVSKVVPIDKSSTILTMILAFIFLHESIGWVTVVGMLLMGVGTFLMLELRKESRADNDGSCDSKESVSLLRRNGWLIYAVLAAVFASLTAIFGRVGVVDMDANLWTAIRTMVVLPMSLMMVFVTGGRKKVKGLGGKSWSFLVLSGIATGLSWLFFYHALQIGNASHVVPIDKLSVVLVIVFAKLFLGEKISRQSFIGLVLLTAGTLLPVFVLG